MLFSDQRKHKINLPLRKSSGEPADVGFLIDYLCEHLMKDPRKDMFVLEGSV